MFMLTDTYPASRSHKVYPGPRTGFVTVVSHSTISVGLVTCCPLRMASWQEMRAQGFGRYHGAAAVASKFASNRGVDALVRIVREGDDETTTAALWALVLLSDSSEVHPYTLSGRPLYSIPYSLLLLMYRRSRRICVKIDFCKKTL